MCPRFEPDMEKTRATLRIFPRGDYLVKITEAAPFMYVREKDKVVVAGMQYNLQMRGKMDANGNVTDEFENEAVTPNKVYIHSEKAYGMAKQFVMIANGYSRDEEDKFNEEFVREHKWFFEGDEEAEDIEATLEVGDAWKTPAGKLIIAHLDSRMYDPKDGSPPSEQQDFRGWMPATQVGTATAAKSAGRGARKSA